MVAAPLPLGVPSIGGISGVEWDAVELPSQFMENFCWEWSVLQHMTSHVETGASLPRPLFDKMLAAKNFQSGLQTLRQVEFSLFDMLLHTSHKPGDQVMGQLEAVRAEGDGRCRRRPGSARCPEGYSTTLT